MKVGDRITFEHWNDGVIVEGEVEEIYPKRVKPIAQDRGIHQRVKVRALKDYPELDVKKGEHFQVLKKNLEVYIQKAKER